MKQFWDDLIKDAKNMTKEELLQLEKELEKSDYDYEIRNNSLLGFRKEDKLGCKADY